MFLPGASALVASLLVAAAPAGSAPSAAERGPRPFLLAPGVSVRNVDEPFDYFVNSWAVIGLKDYVQAARITPAGELVLAGELLCRPRIAAQMAPVNWRVRKTLRKGYLPIVRIDLVVNDRLRCTIEALACPLDAPWKARYDWPEGGNFVNLLRATLTNLRDAPTEAAFGLEWTRKGKPVDCTLKQGAPPGRAEVLCGDDQLCLLELPQGARATQRAGRVEIAAKLAGRASAAVVARVPFAPVRGAQVEALRATSAVTFDTWARRTVSFWEALLARGTQIDVPEAKPMDVYRASLVYQFIGRDKGDLRAGEGFYDSLYLRDAAYQAISLAQAGYLDEARRSLEHFLRFQGKDGFFCTQGGQLDGHGYAMWAMVEYYRLSGDVAWLRRVYPQLARAVEWVRKARRKETDADSPFFGILPAAPADGENLWDGKHHIIGYDWWSLRGLQSAARAARALGKDSDAAAYAREFDQFRKCIFRALDRTKLAYIPPSYEKAGTHWGNLEAIFPSLLVEPTDKRLAATLEFVRTRFGAAADGNGGGFQDGVIQWSPPGSGAIHPYMSQFVTNSHIIRGEQDRAVDGFYSFLLHTTSTQGFPEGVHHRIRKAWGDTVPHLWAAALYHITLRNMLVREQGDVLHLLSAVPAHWLDAGKQVRVTGAPTQFGKASFTAAAEAGAIRIRLGAPRRSPPARVVVHLPTGIEATGASLDGVKLAVAGGRQVVVPGPAAREARELTIRIRRVGKRPATTFLAKVAAYEARRAELFGPIPGLVPVPGDVEARQCVRLDLTRWANTNPLTAPFNVPNPGKYVFAGLPLGERVVAGVPFKVIDPAKNAGKALVVMHGDGACAGFPREVVVPVGAKGRFLCVLGNVTGWAPGDPGAGSRSAVGEYEVRYADGTKQSVPLITGRTVDDWAQVPAATDVAVGLKGGIWHLNVLTIALKPKRVASVVVRDAGTPAAPVVAAMTLVK